MNVRLLSWPIGLPFYFHISKSDDQSKLKQIIEALVVFVILIDMII